MAIRNIRYEGDEILNKKSKPVKEINEKILTLIDDMRETMQAAEGVGIAAPQVGSLKRIVLVDTGEKILEMINPEIIEASGTQKQREGCLSVPGKTGIVERPAYVKIRYRDRNFEEQEAEGTEMLAVCFCHETDHLEGVLYTEKAIETEESDDEEYDEEFDGEFDEEFDGEENA